MLLADDPATAITQFQAGALDPAQFRHCDHVRLAFEMLRRAPFPAVAADYAAGLQRLAARAGRPEAYHETITIAFLSVVAERLLADESDDFAGFAAAHPDLFDKALLARWYGPARLGSAAARRVFLLPEPCRP